MNWYPIATQSVWALAGSTLLASILAWSTTVPPLPAASGAATSWRRDIHAPRAIDTLGLTTAVADMLDRNPFRWERKPTGVRFNPWGPVTSPEANRPPAQRRPTPSLVGIVGGPPWTAILEGIPGREGGVLLRVGEEIGGIRLGAVRGDTARLSGFDTTWALTPRRAWH